jgi:hypothetical protein
MGSGNVKTKEVRKYASKTLRLIALLYCAMPLLYPVWVSVLFELPMSRVLSMLASFFNWLVLGGCVIAGVGLWEMKRWSWYVFLAVNLFLVYLTAFNSATYGETDNTAVMFLISVTLCFGLLLRVGKELRVPYFLPHVKWWESDPGRKLVIPVTLVGGPQDIEGDILDISLQGCFIKTSADLKMDEKVGLQFTVFGSPVEIIGIIVWCAQSAVTHPRGIGVKFEWLTRAQKRKLKLALHRIRKLTIYTSVTQPQPGTLPLADEAEADSDSIEAPTASNPNHAKP